MPTVHFTKNLERHLAVPAAAVPGSTLREALAAVFAANPGVRGYIVDDQGALRQHVMVFIDGQTCRDRVRLSDVVRPDSEVYVMQALSGG
jgi:hypothetical protein